MAGLAHARRRGKWWRTYRWSRAWGDGGSGALVSRARGRGVEGMVVTSARAAAARSGGSRARATHSRLAFSAAWWSGVNPRWLRALIGAPPLSSATSAGVDPAYLRTTTRDGGDDNSNDRGAKDASGSPKNDVSLSPLRMRRRACGHHRHVTAARDGYGGEDVRGPVQRGAAVPVTLVERNAVRRQKRLHALRVSVARSLRARRESKPPPGRRAPPRVRHVTHTHMHPHVYTCTHTHTHT